MAKRKRYTDDFRASAILMLEAQGYPTIKGAMNAVSEYLHVPPRTLRRWYKGEQNPPPVELVRQKKACLEDRLSELLETFVDEMFNAAEDANLQQLSTSFGITFDKLQLLKGEPTERHDYTISETDRLSRLDQLLNTARDRRTGSLADGRDDTAIH